MIEIRAYQCGFCKKYGKSKSNIQKHEKQCYHNPITKACATCGNLYQQEYEIPNNSDYPFGSIISYMPTCLVGFEISSLCNGEKVINLNNRCIKWTPKEEIEE